MYIVLSVNYSYLLIPMSPEAGLFVALLENAIVCKENGYGSSATFTQTDEPISITMIANNRFIATPSKEFSAMKDLSVMASRAYEAETERDKVKKELEDLKLKFAPFMEKPVEIKENI